MIRHAFAHLLHAVARRIDPAPPASAAPPYVYTTTPGVTTWPTTPWPYQVWSGSQGPKRIN